MSKTAKTRALSWKNLGKVSKGCADARSTRQSSYRDYTERFEGKLWAEGRLLDCDMYLMGGPRTVLKQELIYPSSPGGGDPCFTDSFSIRLPHFGV